MLEVRTASIGFQNKKERKIVLDGLSFSLEKGSMLCILGANGSGKTTLFRTMLGFQPLLEGNMYVDGENLQLLKREQLAVKIGYVPQFHTPPFPYQVCDVVLMGRNARLNGLSMPDRKDEMLVCEALERLGIVHLKNEIYTRLSGGERQMVLIARALVQETDYILMDEPASSLDFGNQIRLLNVLTSLAEEGKGVAFTTHNPDHAFQTSANVLAITGKKSFALGKAEEVIDDRLLNEMYHIDAEVVTSILKNGHISRQVAADNNV